MAQKEKDNGEPREQNVIRSLFQNLLGGSSKKQNTLTDEEDTSAGATAEENLLFQENPYQPVDLPEEATKPEEGERKPEKEDEDLLPQVGSSLYTLYRRHRGQPPQKDESAIFNVSQFTEEHTSPTDTERGWIHDFERKAKTILAKEDHDDESPVDFTPIIKVANNRMAAYLFALPPTFEGQEIEPERIYSALKDAGVINGINEFKIETICDTQQYLTILKVAEGTEPIDGEDGYVKDHFDREVEIHLTVKDDNTIDYKDLGWLQTIREDEVICDIIAPTKAVSGYNVFNGEVRGKDGRKATVPKGQGTKLNEEEETLVAAQDGVVTFDNGRFRVDPLLIIETNVETVTGNIETVGDVLIYGDVLEGFTVEATGNVTVQGMVEGAKIMAGGDIQVGRGMNGNSHGTMQAKGEVRSKFIENGTVTAGGKIICDTIINSTISSDEAIEVRTGKGVIIGGNITALERIDALSIGNESNRNIVINMGSTANFLRDKRELEQKKNDLTREIDEIEKNITFLDAGATNPVPALVTMQDDLKLKLSVQKMQLANVERRLGQMQKKQANNKDCRLCAEVIYPPAQITIGSVTKILRQVSFNALVYLKNGDVHVANV